MNSLLLHLSDIHFRAQANPILQKLAAIVAATRTHGAGINACIIAASGDIAFSGKQEEYKEAEIFFASLRTSLQEVLPNIPIHWAFIPGNPDCDHNKATSMRRMILKSTPAVLDEIGKGDTSIVDTATEVQREFFQFFNKLEPGAGPSSGDRRLKYTAKSQINGESVSLECYNTAWLSQLEEKQGKLFFPENLLRDEKSDSCLAISMFHHPYNWLNPDNARRFRKHVETTADVILTGHEHVPDVYEKTRVLGQVTHYVEGAVLQDSDENMSGFNVLLIDSDESKWKCSNIFGNLASGYIRRF